MPYLAQDRASLYPPATLHIVSEISCLTFPVFRTIRDYHKTSDKLAIIHRYFGDILLINYRYFTDIGAKVDLLP